MQVKLTSNSKKVQRDLKKKGRKVSDSMRRALSVTALEGINIIEERTRKGIGYKGGAFKPYSDKYALFRSQQGRGVKPDLQFTGQMLGSMTSKANNREANIFFTRAAESKKAAMNNKSRPFFGFSGQEENTLSRVFFRVIERVLK